MALGADGKQYILNASVVPDTYVPRDGTNTVKVQDMVIIGIRKLEK